MSRYQLIGLIYAVVAIIFLITYLLEGRSSKPLAEKKFAKSLTFAWLARVLIGGLFLYSGFVKANDYIGFGYKLEEYFYVFGTRFMVPFAQPLAWFISVFEIALGVAIILGYRMKLTLWLSLIMMIFFTFLTGYSHITGSVTDCGCFGDALKITPLESFIKDIILTVMLIPLFLMRHIIKVFPNARIAGISTAAFFLISGIYSWYCHENLPQIDYRAYKVGTDLAICTTVPGPDGIPKCKDWEVYYDNDTGEGPDPFSGNTLMIITYDLNKAPADALKKAGSLSSALSNGNIQIIGVCSNTTEDTEKAISQFSLNYPMAFMDNTVLKTIVRSNPGYMLLKEGVVLKKWHHNNTPSPEEIKDLLK